MPTPQCGFYPSEPGKPTFARPRPVWFGLGPIRRPAHPSSDPSAARPVRQSDPIQLIWPKQRDIAFKFKPRFHLLAPNSTEILLLLAEIDTKGRLWHQTVLTIIK